MKKINKNIIWGFAVAFLFVITTNEDIAMYHSESFQLSKDKISRKEFVPLQFERIKDTVFVLGEHYVEVSLEKQIAYLHFRNGEIKEYPISSGSDKILKGLKTTEGIFTVQTKTPKAISRQFNNAELFYWIGFNGNFGFHGLAGNGYYSYLGIRPSSHGCLRISREDGKDLYDYVKLGTPIFVYSKEPARTLAFANHEEYYCSSSILLSGNVKEINKMMLDRLNNLYNGNAHIRNRTKIYIDGKTVLRSVKIMPGCEELIPDKHNLPLYATSFDISRNDKLKFNIILQFDSDDPSANDNEDL